MVVRARYCTNIADNFMLNKKSIIIEQLKINTTINMSYE